MDSISSISFPNEPLIDQLISVEHNVEPFLSSLLGGCISKATPNPSKSDDKNGQEMFNVVFNCAGSFGKEILLIESIL